MEVSFPVPDVSFVLNSVLINKWVPINCWLNLKERRASVG